MKIDKDSDYFKISFYALVVIMLSILFLQFLQNITYFKTYAMSIVGLSMPFVYGFIIAYLINPCMVYVEKNICTGLLKMKSKRGKRALSVVFSYIVAVLLISVFFSIILPQVVTSLYGLIINIPSYIEISVEYFNDIIKEYFEQMPLSQTQIASVLDFVNTTMLGFLNTIKNFIPRIYDFAISFTNSIKNVILGLIISIYMLVSKEQFIAQIKKCVYAFLKSETGDRTVLMFRYINSTFGGFIYAKVLDSLIIGVICFIGMSMLNIPYAILVSLIVGVTNVIPYFGPFIGAIPSIFIILFANPFKALVFAIFVLILQQFDGNVLGPKLLGDSIGISSFWVIFAVIIMGGIFGVTGMFIGVPAFAILYTLAKSYVEVKLEQKNMPISSKDYMQEEQ